MALTFTLKLSYIYLHSSTMVGIWERLWGTLGTVPMETPNPDGPAPEVMLLRLLLAGLALLGVVYFLKASGGCLENLFDAKTWVRNNRCV